MYVMVNDLARITLVHKISYLVIFTAGVIILRRHHLLALTILGTYLFWELLIGCAETKFNDLRSSAFSILKKLLWGPSEPVQCPCARSDGWSQRMYS